MIKLRNLEKFYESGAGRTYVLRQINSEIGEGEFVTIMGPSGAGKTTLLSILGMLDGSWNGEYWLYDNPVHELKTKHRNELHKRYIGFVFQQYHLLDNLTVYENLDIPLSSPPSWPTRWTDSTLSARKICIRASSPAASNSSWPSPAP
jgi:ABC-type lipoprotein export system ATPase subunit